MSIDLSRPDVALCAGNIPNIYWHNLKSLSISHNLQYLRAAYPTSQEVYPYTVDEDAFMDAWLPFFKRLPSLKKLRIILYSRNWVNSWTDLDARLPKLNQEAICAVLASPLINLLRDGLHLPRHCTETCPTRQCEVELNFQDLIFPLGSPGWETIWQLFTPFRKVSLAFRVGKNWKSFYERQEDDPLPFWTVFDGDQLRHVKFSIIDNYAIPLLDDVQTITHLECTTLHHHPALLWRSLERISPTLECLSLSGSGRPYWQNVTEILVPDRQAVFPQLRNLRLDTTAFEVLMAIGDVILAPALKTVYFEWKIQEGEAPNQSRLAVVIRRVRDFERFNKRLPAHCQRTYRIAIAGCPRYTGRVLSHFQDLSRKRLVEFSIDLGRFGPYQCRHGQSRKNPRDVSKHFRTLAVAIPRSCRTAVTELSFGIEYLKPTSKVILLKNLRKVAVDVPKSPSAFQLQLPFTSLSAPALEEHRVRIQDDIQYDSYCTERQTSSWPGVLSSEQPGHASSATDEALTYFEELEKYLPVWQSLKKLQLTANFTNSDVSMLPERGRVLAQCCKRRIEIQVDYTYDSFGRLDNSDCRCGKCDEQAERTYDLSSSDFGYQFRVFYNKLEPALDLVEQYSSNLNNH